MKLESLQPVIDELENKTLTEEQIHQMIDKALTPPKWIIYLLRIISLVFLLPLTFIAMVYQWLRHNYGYLRFGGELIIYQKTEHKQYVQGLFKELENRLK